MWVLAGRNDIGWLTLYLPRATEFSDDGSTWNGAYGPRLRAWNGVDQLERVLSALRQEKASRRALMTLYDPSLDVLSSKDIPCNNWLHWLIRDDHLHLNVAIRSSDIVWGFSGINSFEWSILQEMMAFWTGAHIGRATYFASSFHIYERHYEMAKKVVGGYRGRTCYDFGIKPARFCTPWEQFNQALDAWFEAEAKARRSPDDPVEQRGLSDPFLYQSVQLLRLYQGMKAGWDAPRLASELAKLPETDLTAAAYEFFARAHPNALKLPPSQPAISRFLSDYVQNTDLETAATFREVTAVIKALHREKDQAYGNAWKKRGEIIGILSNIARKVDRLEQYVTRRSELADESILDTAVDLLAYSTKYILFLLEAENAGSIDPLPSSAPQPYSDYSVNFDTFLDTMSVADKDGLHAAELETGIIRTFAKLEKLASDKASVGVRLESAKELAKYALAYTNFLARERPNLLADMRANFPE
jgi:thymidylate synthase